jgi:assimilatory nitrate reductase catalytic subunit
MVLTARGPEQQSKGTDTVKAWINLCLASGKAGRPYSGYGCLTGQGNGQGGREHGQKADQLPGYRSIEDPAAREHVAGVWGVDAAALPGAGRSAYELLDSLGRPGPDGVRGLLVMGSNPVVSAPRAAHVTERLRALDLLVVSELALSETAQLADVVLPSTQWAEETGTMTNLEGRVILRRRAVDAPEGVRSDLWLMRELAARLGVDRGFDDDPETVFDELRRASAGGPADYSGITYERIRAEDGVFWPCPATDHPGTPRLFLDAFATPDGRARFSAVTHRPAAEEPDTDYPLHLTTGRVLSQYQSGTQTRRVAALNTAAPGPFVELHPLLARRLGVGEGELLAVTSRRGRAVAPARITDTIRPDTVFMPFHWAGPGRANTLTNPALDPTSKMPEFKVCAVRVEAARADAERATAERTPKAERAEARGTEPAQTGAAARAKAGRVETGRAKAGRVETDNTTPATAESAEPEKAEPARAERSEAAGTAPAEAGRTGAERTPKAERAEARGAEPAQTGAAAPAKARRTEAGVARSRAGTGSTSTSAPAPAPARASAAPGAPA